MIGLGISNDIRGGHACGIVIDDQVEYGTGEQKLFANFFYKSKLLKDISKCHFAIGHDRKASVGGLDPDKAQPICIYEGNKLQFVLTHNGTIDNWKELAGKYIPGENIINKNDSYVMAHIFYKKGYDVLAEYKGGGMFVTIDYRKDTPEIRMFKGASKVHKYDKEAEEERPLYITIEDNAIWYSSMPDSLLAFRFGHNILKLNSNILYKVSSDLKFIRMKEYDRTEVYQEKIFSYFEDDEYSDYYNRNSYGNTSVTTTTKSNFTEVFTKENPGKIEGSGYIAPNKVFYNNDSRYYKGEFLCHGVYNIDKWGYTHSKNTEEYSAAFFSGRLLYSKRAYDILTNFHESKGLTEEEFLILYPEVIDLFSYLPFSILDKNSKDKWFKQASLDIEEEYSGSLNPPFHYDTLYEVTDGYILKRIRWSGIVAIDKYMEAKKTWEEDTKDVDFVELIEKHINAGNI